MTTHDEKPRRTWRWSVLLAIGLFVLMFVARLFFDRLG